jgi:hypothetical protein
VEEKKDKKRKKDNVGNVCLLYPFYILSLFKITPSAQCPHCLKPHSASQPVSTGGSFTGEKPGA